ncbi:hypothetical protein LTR95_004907 [Oleoguttula sp. CCFEE 5521]
MAWLAGQVEQAPCGICEQPALAGKTVPCNGSHPTAVEMHFYCADLKNVEEANTKAVYCTPCKAIQTSAANAGQASTSAVSQSAGSQHGAATVGDLPNNLPHIGMTCFVATAIQLFGSLDDLYTLAVPTNFRCKPLDHSGRIASEWVHGVYDTPALTTRALNKQTRSAEVLVKLLHKLFADIRTPGKLITESAMGRVFDAIKGTHESKYSLEQMNDPFFLFVNIMEAFILVTDDSEPVARGRLTNMNQEDDAKFQSRTDMARYPLASFAPARYNAYCDEGRATRLLGLFAVQFIEERNCATCDGVVRNALHQMHIMLDLPPRDAAPHILEGMLDTWQSGETLDDWPCPNGHMNTVAPIRRCLTYLPNYLMVHFNRSNGRPDEVNIPEFLDPNRWGNAAHLFTDRDPLKDFPDRSNIYRLHAMAMFVHGIHYIADFVYQGRCVTADDLGRQVRAAHPQASIDAKNVIYLAVYAQVKGHQSLPYVADSNEQTSGFILKSGAAKPRAGNPAYRGLSLGDLSQIC